MSSFFPNPSPIPSLPLLTHPVSFYLFPFLSLPNESQLLYLLLLLYPNPCTFSTLPLFSNLSLFSSISLQTLSQLSPLLSSTQPTPNSTPSSITFSPFFPFSTASLLFLFQFPPNPIPTLFDSHFTLFFSCLAGSRRPAREASRLWRVPVLYMVTRGWRGGTGPLVRVVFIPSYIVHTS